ncbi:MAG: hypothetical protein WBD55_01105 [Dehalococcoidia bacterium]
MTANVRRTRRATNAHTGRAASTAGKGAKPQRKRTLGARAAYTRYGALKAEQGLSPHRDMVLRMAARLHVLFLNATGRLFREGEVRQDGEPKALLRQAALLAEQVQAHLEYVFPNTTPDDGKGGADAMFAQYRGGDK